MSKILLVVLLALFCAAEVTSRVDLYARHNPPNGWSLVSKVPKPDTLLEIRFALVKQNLDALETAFWDVSNPKSDNYAKYWSRDQILDLIAPPKEKHDVVFNWIKNHHGAEKITKLVSHRDCIVLQAPISFIGSLMGVEMRTFRHTEDVEIVRQFGVSSIPSEVADSIVLVENLNLFPLIKFNRKKSTPLSIWDQPPPADNPYNFNWVSYNVPYTEKMLYNVPEGHTVSNKNVTQGVFSQAAYGAYNATDLHQFDTLNNLKKAQAPEYLGNSPPGSYAGTEPTLDVQYITSHGLGAKTYFWTIDGWMYTFATEIFNQQNPEGPLVNSISYAWPEGDQCDPLLLSECAYGNEFNGNSSLYMNATNIEWMKLGLKGHTILSSSGDQGAPGDFNLVCDNYTNPLGPLYPTSSPYIISVGATAMEGSGNGIGLAENLASQHESPQIKKANAPPPPTSPPPICQQFNCSAGKTEVPCILDNAIFTTGGGFSGHFPQPSYQSTIVNAYLNSGVKLPPSEYFNSQNRAFPDIGAIGQNVLIVQSGQILVTGGTSASAPTIGGIMSLLNDYLMNHGQGPLGFANPLLYQMASECPDCFHNVTKYNNYCTEDACCQYGYESAKGWDPVTGIGSPNFSNMITYLKNNVLNRKK